MNDLHALEWRIREATKLVAAANVLIEEQRATIVDLERQLSELRREAIAQLWNIRNVSSELVNSWVTWSKPIGQLCTRSDAQARALARWELNRSTWYDVDDRLLGLPARGMMIERRPPIEGRP